MTTHACVPHPPPSRPAKRRRSTSLSSHREELVTRHPRTQLQRTRTLSNVPLALFARVESTHSPNTPPVATGDRAWLVVGLKVSVWHHHHHHQHSHPGHGAGLLQARDPAAATTARESVEGRCGSYGVERRAPCRSALPLRPSHSPPLCACGSYPGNRRAAVATRNCWWRDTLQPPPPPSPIATTASATGSPSLR